MDWNCPSCTYSNAKEDSACEICGFTSPETLALFADPQPITIHTAEVPWTCACGIQNPQRMLACSACTLLGTSRQQFNKIHIENINDDRAEVPVPPLVACTPTESKLSSSFHSSASKSMPKFASDSLLAEVLAMNCGFDVPDICRALLQTGNVSAEAAIAQLNKGGEAVQPEVSPDEKDDANLNDFVLKEYIRDFAGLVPNLMTHVEEFMVVMASLGVKSAGDRSRAFALLEALKSETEDAELAQFLTQDEEKSKPVKRHLQSEDLEFAWRLERGELDEDCLLHQDFICPSCKQPRQIGLLLTNCTHCLCTACIQRIAGRAAAGASCSECLTTLHVNDIRAVCGRDAADRVSEALARGLVMEGGGVQCLGGCGNVMDFHKNNLPREPYPCTFCKVMNCFQCGVVHGSQSCAEYKAVKALQETLSRMPATAASTTEEQWHSLRQAVYAVQATPYQGPDLETASGLLKQAPPPPRGSSTFAQHWQRQERPCELFKVVASSPEYQILQKHLTGGFKTIISLQRIQNPALWDNYQRYVARNIGCQEGFFWHGTRKSHPSVVYETVGFDKKFSRVGGCLWFAVQSTYSMSGFQHSHGGESMVLLALVAHRGRDGDVKFIRGDQILNVFENTCTYPAYLVTYK